jgi:hypothetical protein
MSTYILLATKTCAAVFSPKVVCHDMHELVTQKTWQLDMQLLKKISF